MLRKVLTPIQDDTEEAPWMVMGMSQSEEASDFYTSLRLELRRRGEPLLIATMLPILYHPIPGGRREQLAPDVLVARVPAYRRNSYDVEREGVPPAFVLEVVSPESRQRDLQVKPERYDVMGVEEYALFAPRMPDGRLLLEPPLRGYRRDVAKGEYVPWTPDEQGRLYSEVLGLWLTVRDDDLRAQRPDGSWVPTPEEQADELERLHAEPRRRRGSEPS